MTDPAEVVSVLVALKFVVVSTVVFLVVPFEDAVALLPLVLVLLFALYAYRR